MGTRYTFVCEECGYNASVSGGKDSGYLLDVETMICNYCHELVDVAIGPADGVIFEKEIEEEVMEDIGKCPECGRKKLSSWSPEAKTCPKCGKQMTLDLDAPVVEWE